MANTKPDTNPKPKKMKNKTSSKKLLSGPNLASMKPQSSRLDNPFETIWSRRKFDVLGKKRKGEERRTGLARSIAIEKRKNTLLKEYKESNKSSVFLDKRIGEKNDSLGEFDKAILRFQRERQVKMNRKSKFNLSDGEEEDVGVHGDGDFSGRDDFEDEDELPLDDYNEDEPEKKLSLSGEANNMRNGLVQGEEDKHKSKKEVMEEIILKSKFFKAQKAKEKEENEELMEQLDKDFVALVQSKALLSLTQPSKMAALKALVNKGNSKELTKKDDVATPARKESSNQEQPDSYDKLVKEMVLEKRAHPSDRTKTEEEIAQEERERLQQLEEERQKRMAVADDSSDEGEDDQDDVDRGSTKKLRSTSGDDLGDSFSLDEEPRKKKGWVDEILDRAAKSRENEEDTSSEEPGSDADGSSDEGENEEEESEDDDELGNTTSLKDWEQSDDDNLVTSLEEEEGEEEDDDEEQREGGIKGKGMQKAKNMIALKVKKQKTDTLSIKNIKESVKQPQRQHDALPYIIEVPNSLDELCSLLNGRSDSEIIEAINRIRVSNAIRLAAENRKKMQVFYGVLLQYFAVEANKKPLKFKLLNLLVKPLIEMSMETPYFAAICARQRILRIRSQFCEDIKNPEKSCWPSLKTLFLLRLWSMTFPCSDFRHVVMTPIILLMCEYLMRCPITSGRDIAIGSFLCSILLSVTKQSQKFCPEVIIFLRTLLMSALETESRLLQHSEFYYLSELKMLRPWLWLRDRVPGIQTLNFLTVMNLPDDSRFFSSDNFRTSMLMSVVETLQGFVDIYGGYNSFPEIFLPVSSLLHEVGKEEYLPNTLKDKIKDVSEAIVRKADKHHTLRQPLQMRKQKPVAIKLLTPKFEENFVKGRDYDPDRERAERKKLKKLIKQEARGAIRELRKDNYFLLEEKEKDRALLEEEKAERSGKTRAFLQEQEHAFKSGQLGKGRKRRR